jgi:hypothetical protein
MFEMYIYTMGGQDYADQISELLDPDGMCISPLGLSVGPMAPQAIKRRWILCSGLRIW